MLARDAVDSADVLEASQALPAVADTPYFVNFKEYGDRLGAPAPPAPLVELPAEEKAAADEAERHHNARVGVLKNPEYQELIGRVLENTVFNLLQEASHGELNLT